MTDVSGIFVSPNFTIAKMLTGRFEDKVEIFADRVNGWSLLHAHHLASDQYELSQHAGFAILAIIGNYFEMITSFAKGQSSNGKSKVFFADGLKDVFPTLIDQVRPGFSEPEKVIDDLADAVYSDVRCGMFHEGMTKARVVLSSGFEKAIEIKYDDTSKDLSINVNPFRLVAEVQNHFQGYVAKLLNPENELLRKNFGEEWDRRHTIFPGARLT